jgi:hypothetical protein
VNVDSLSISTFPLETLQVATFDEGINHVIDVGKGGFVFDRMDVYFSIILDQPSSSILLGNEEAWRGVWRFGWANFACLQFFIHKFIKHLLFYRGHAVILGGQFFGASGTKLISWSHSCHPGSLSKFFFSNMWLNTSMYWGFIPLLTPFLSSSGASVFLTLTSFQHGWHRAGHLSKTTCLFVQSMEGLWTISQSCPNSMSFHPMSRKCVGGYLSTDNRCPPPEGTVFACLSS